jgi:DNA (cytosine-5)-methyltransferase 1
MSETFETSSQASLPLIPNATSSPVLEDGPSLSGLQAGQDSRPVWTGSCPCQSFSQAGSGKGFADERHLWPAWFHLIDICNPPTVLGEQVEAAIKHGWLDLVQDDMEGINYSFASVGLPAPCAGAKHNRPRRWFVANAKWNQQSRQEPCQRDTPGVGRIEQSVSWDRDWQCALREFRAVDDGLRYGVEATDAIRNAIVPQVAAKFIESYLDVSREA